ASPGDTIIIADGTTCLGNFNVSTPVTIRSTTAAGATIDGGSVEAGPVVDVTTGGSVTLQNLTITGGVNLLTTGNGGGVHINAATVSIIDSTITGNSAVDGGGIYNELAGTVVVSGGSITDNTATVAGGGAFSNGTSTFSGVNVGTSLSPNIAPNGGGLYNKGTMNVNSLTNVDSNTATSVAGGGGGIWNDATLNIDNAIITSNDATDAGGGIHNISGGDLNVTNTEITLNTAAAAGGVLNNNGAEAGSTADITDSMVTLNQATDASGLGGGGIYNISDFSHVLKATLTLDGTTVSGNTSANDGAAGVRNQDSTATITDSTVANNDATGSGGGIRTSGTLTVTDTTISGNTTTSTGGGIALDGTGSTVTVTGSVIDNNDATGDGGGVSAGGLGTSATISSSSITRNDAASGAGVSSGTGAAVAVTNSTVTDNHATSQGGGFFTQGDLTITHATITSNDATSEGGGVRVIGTPAVTLTGTILYSNTGGSGANCSGPLSSGGYNYVGAKTAPCVYTGAGTDLPVLADPKLGALGFYGTTTEHRPLLDGSDMVDAGGACGLGSDQLGTTRALGAACDVGALEDVFDQVLLVEPNGRWHIRIPGQADRTFWYGDPADVPIFGDWDGDGIDTPGAYRQGPGGGYAYMTNSLPGDGQVGVADFNFFFGDPGDEVLTGDWNGDGVDSLGVNRGGHLFLTNTNGSGGAPVPTHYDFFFGVDGDRAFGGDADGDGSDGVFLYRGSGPGAGFVYFTNETPVGPGGVASTADNFFFGIASDEFTSGDWNGDDVDTAGIFRGSDTTVYLTNTNASGGAPAPTDDSFVWGTAGWVPVSGVWADTPS
ncbi:MAG: beta strand repeat-containing protein, partial [Acidimicrobiia bacterium]